jgi:hypothetical protein
MARSEPTLRTVAVPDEARPNNTFQVEIEVRQDGPNAFGSDGHCTSRNIDLFAWTTPVEVFVDGERVDRTELCLAPGNTRTTSIPLTLDAGDHRVKVRVMSVGGSAYDFEQGGERVADVRTATIAVSSEARDPSEPTTGDKFRRWLESIAERLGASTTQIGLGALLAVGVLLFV